MRKHGFLVFLAALVGLVSLGLALARSTRSPSPRGEGSVPLEVRDGRLVVTLDHAGRPLRLILDTGAERSAIARAALGRVEAPLVGQTRLMGAGGGRIVPVAMLGPLSLGGLSVNRLPALVIRDEALGGYDGILGLDLLRRLPLSVDAPARRLGFQASIGSGAIPLRDVGGGIVAFDVEVDGAPATAILDTGLQRTLLNSAAARAAGLVGQPARPARGLDGRAIPSDTATVQRIAVGTATLLANANVRIADAPLFRAAGLDDVPALLLGADALLHCRFVIDWDGARMMPCAPRQPLD